MGMNAWIPRNLRDDGMIPMNESPSYASFVKQYVLRSDHEQALDEKDKAYQQLMEHAVKFAEAFEVIANDNNITCIEVQRFLNSPEVQAWKERHP